MKLPFEDGQEMFYYENGKIKSFYAYYQNCIAKVLSDGIVMFTVTTSKSTVPLMLEEIEVSVEALEKKVLEKVKGKFNSYRNAPKEANA